MVSSRKEDVLKQEKEEALLSPYSLIFSIILHPERKKKKCNREKGDEGARRALGVESRV